MLLNRFNRDYIAIVPTTKMKATGQQRQMFRSEGSRFFCRSEAFAVNQSFCSFFCSLGYTLPRT